MTTLGIVSSYSESCGNASFTKVLHDTIEYYTDTKVEVVELDLKLLQSANRTTRRYAETHVRKICEQLKKFDAVNIQMEAGLYGSLPQDIIRRSKKIMMANPNTSVTLHSPRIVSTTPSDSVSPIKHLLKLKIRTGIYELLLDLKRKKQYFVNKTIIKNAIKQNCQIIVHTKRAKDLICLFYHYDFVDVHPLKFVIEDSIEDKTILENIRWELELKTTDTLIGLFGYLTENKGHLDAISAISYLPDNYKLLIFGRQHPQTIKSDGKVDMYIEKLVKAINSHNLARRVFFLGELTDHDFLSVAKNIDIAWLPYYENGQDGSGIASILLDSCPRVLCSTSFAFDELFKLTPYKNVSRFCIGNARELSTKTEMILKRPIPSYPYSESPLYNIRTQVDTYMKVFTHASKKNYKNS